MKPTPNTAERGVQRREVLRRRGLAKLLARLELRKGVPRRAFTDLIADCFVRYERGCEAAVIDQRPETNGLSLWVATKSEAEAMLYWADVLKTKRDRTALRHLWGVLPRDHPFVRGIRPVAEAVSLERPLRNAVKGLGLRRTNHLLVSIWGLLRSLAHSGRTGDSVCETERLLVAGGALREREDGVEALQRRLTRLGGAREADRIGFLLLATETALRAFAPPCSVSVVWLDQGPVIGIVPGGTPVPPPTKRDRAAIAAFGRSLR